MSQTTPPAQEKKDYLLDINGVSTKSPVTRQLIFALCLSVAAFFLISMLDLSAYGEMASRGLALFVSLVLFMVFSGLDVFVNSLIMIFLGIALHFWEWKDVSGALGTSQFYTMLGMTIVAMGCEFTPFGKRVAYFFLERFGQKPLSLVVIFGFVTALMSAFVSNIATLILMSSIAASLLEAMGEKPGESVIGKALMLLVSAAAMFGGCALISGSPYGNTVAISMLETASEGLYTVTYAQWAFYGVISFAICIVPLCFIYIKCSGMKSKGYTLPPKSYYEEKKKELGPVRGSEIRWCIIVVAMVALMISGKNTAEMAMLFATISFLPVVGTTPVRDCTSRVPLRILMIICTIPMMSKLLTTTGVIDWMTHMLEGRLAISSPLVFSMVTCLIMGLAINILVNTSSAVGPSLIAIFTPIAIAMGFNPVVVLMPAMLASGFFWAMGMNAIMMMNKGYGYWDDKDTMLPGYLAIVFTSVAMPIICCGLSSILGMSPML